jgi:putative phosphoribosyl transferase
MTDDRFPDRAAAGRLLAGELAARLRPPPADEVVLLGLPRGGVPVAAEIASVLAAPLDVLVVRKLGLPGHEELAIGAIASVGNVLEVIRNDDVIRRFAVTDAGFDRVLRDETAELRRRELSYRAARPAQVVEAKTVVVVDDGLATGATMRAALAGLRRQLPNRLIVVVPVASRQACAEVARIADEVICLRTPEPFLAVGQAYRDFSPTTDDEVRHALVRAEGAARPS